MNHLDLRTPIIRCWRRSLLWYQGTPRSINCGSAINTLASLNIWIITRIYSNLQKRCLGHQPHPFWWIYAHTIMYITTKYMPILLYENKIKWYEICPEIFIKMFHYRHIAITISLPSKFGINLKCPCPLRLLAGSKCNWSNILTSAKNTKAEISMTTRRPKNQSNHIKWFLYYTLIRWFSVAFVYLCIFFVGALFFLILYNYYARTLRNARLPIRPKTGRESAPSPQERPIYLNHYPIMVSSVSWNVYLTNDFATYAKKSALYMQPISYFMQFN